MPLTYIQVPTTPHATQSTHLAQHVSPPPLPKLHLVIYHSCHMLH